MPVFVIFIKLLLYSLLWMFLSLSFRCPLFRKRCRSSNSRLYSSTVFHLFLHSHFFEINSCLGMLVYNQKMNRRPRNGKCWFCSLYLDFVFKFVCFVIQQLAVTFQNCPCGNTKWFLSCSVYFLLEPIKCHVFFDGDKAVIDLFIKNCFDKVRFLARFFSSRRANF